MGLVHVLRLILLQICVLAHLSQAGRQIDQSLAPDSGTVPSFYPASKVHPRHRHHHGIVRKKLAVFTTITTAATTMEPVTDKEPENYEEPVYELPPIEYGYQNSELAKIVEQPKPRIVERRKPAWANQHQMPKVAEISPNKVEVSRVTTKPAEESGYLSLDDEEKEEQVSSEKRLDYVRPQVDSPQPSNFVPFQEISYPVVAGENGQNKMPVLEPLPEDERTLSQPHLHPVAKSAPAMSNPIKVIPLNFIDQPSAEMMMMPFVAGSPLMPPKMQQMQQQQQQQEQPPQLPQPVGQVVDVSMVPSLPVVAGFHLGANNNLHLVPNQPPNQPSQAQQTQRQFFHQVKTIKKTEQQFRALPILPQQKLQQVPSNQGYEPQAPVTLMPPQDAGMNQHYLNHPQFQPVLPGLVETQPPPTSTTTPAFNSDDDGTTPELVLNMHPQKQNRSTYSCHGKRFLASEREVGDVKCCQTKPYKWRLMLCIAGELIDSVSPVHVTPFEGVEVSTSTTPRYRTRQPYVDFVRTGHKVGFRPAAEQQQGNIPFIQPDALPGAMIAAYQKQQAKSSTSTTTTSTTTTTPMTTTTEPPTPEPLIDHQARNAGFQSIFVNPDQLQIEPSPRPSVAVDLNQVWNSLGQYIANHRSEFREPQIVTFDKNFNPIVSIDEGEEEVGEDFYETTPINQFSTTEEPLPQQNETLVDFTNAHVASVPSSFSSNYHSSRVMMVRCNNQEWPISEPLGTYICCGDMLHYTLLDHIVCNDELRPPAVVHHDMPEQMQRGQLFDTMITSPASNVNEVVKIQPRSSSVATKARLMPNFVQMYTPAAPKLDGLESFCESAGGDRSKFCCGERLYEKEFGQICCQGNYGFSKAGKVHCCGPAIFNVHTHECNSEEQVVDRIQRKLVHFFS